MEKKKTSRLRNGGRWMGEGGRLQVQADDCTQNRGGEGRGRDGLGKQRPKRTMEGFFIFLVSVWEKKNHHERAKDARCTEKKLRTDASSE